MSGLRNGADFDETTRPSPGVGAAPNPQSRYLLRRGPEFYGIWDAGSPDGDVIERFPPTAAGWFAARRRVDELDQRGGAPITSPSTNGTTLFAAGAVLFGVVLGVAGLFPNYLAGSNLVSAADQLIPHVAYIAGWAFVAALLLVDRRFARGAAGLGVGLGLISFGFFLTDVLTAGAGRGETTGAGLYFSLAGWLACSAGSAAALFALRSPTAGAGRDAWRHPLVFVGGIGALGAAVAFALPWDSYTVTTALTGSTQTITAGDVFANPGAIIAGNVITMILIVGVLVLAIARRPRLFGVHLVAGALVPLVAQVFATLAQPLPPLSNFGITAIQEAEGQVSLAGSYTGWFYLYCAFVAALVVLAGWIASAPSSEAKA
jgi:hypothetical protein